LNCFGVVWAALAGSNAKTNAAATLNLKRDVGIFIASLWRGVRASFSRAADPAPLEGTQVLSNLSLQPWSAPMRTIGRTIFALAILAIGVETILCSGTSSADPAYGYRTLDIIPWLPPIPWLAVLVGLLYVACGIGLLVPRTRRRAALATGAGLFLATLVLCLPRSLAHFGSVSLRTGVFEPLGLGAWLG